MVQSPKPILDVYILNVYMCTYTYTLYIYTHYMYIYITAMCYASIIISKQNLKRKTKMAYYSPILLGLQVHLSFQILNLVLKWPPSPNTQERRQLMLFPILYVVSQHFTLSVIL
jgi:hypothetical protein